MSAALAVPAGAQDADVDPLLLAAERFGAVTSAHATTYQIYRIPLSYAVRDPADHPWGLSLTFPVSLGTNQLSASTGVGDFFERIQTVSVTPGIELQTPLSPAWVLKPYAEAGIRGASTGGATDSTVAIGVRSVGAYHPGATALTVGLGARYASPRTRRDVIDDYTSLEAGLDAQWAVGGSGSRAWRAGAYGIVRYFPDFTLAAPVETGLGWVHEAGFSVSATPTLKVLGIAIPWIGVGYRWGDAFSGVRLNLAFPF